MERRKVMSEIKMERSLLSLLASSLFGGWTEGASKGLSLLYELLSLSLCALLSRTHAVFGVFPLGFAYLCLCRRRVLFSLFGCILGTIGMGQAGIVYSLVYIFIFLARVFLSAPLERRRFLPICESYFCESIQLRISLLLTVGLSLSLYELILFGISATSLYFSLGMMCLPLVCAFLFLGVTDSEIGWGDILGIVRGKSAEKPYDFGKCNPVYTQICMLFLSVCVTRSLSSFSIFGLSLGFFFCALSTLFVSRRFGAIRGAIVGGVCSLVLNITYAPSFCALGILSGILWQFGSFYSLTLGSAAAVGWAGYIGGVGGFVELAPEICVVSLLCMPFFSSVRSEALQGKEQQRIQKLEKRASSLAKPEEKTERSSYLASALAGVSNLFFTTPDVRRPSRDEYFALCEDVCEQRCSRCERREACWSTPSSLAYSSVCRISDSLFSVGRIKKGDVSDEMLTLCPDFNDVCEQIKNRAAELGLERIKGDKTRFISLDYAMMSKLIEKCSSKEKREMAEDDVTASALRKVAREICGEDVSVSVFGTRKKSIAISSYNGEKLRKNASRLHDSFSQVCGCRLRDFEFSKSEGIVSATTQYKKKFDVEFAIACAPSGNGEISGDRAKCFSSRDGVFYALISDGMGTGECAAATSSVCISFLEKMLRAGAGKSLSLRMLNNIIRSKDKECSTTVDLFECDLIYGKSTFLKCGASPTFLKRGDEISVISSSSTPIGLLRSTDAQKSDQKIQNGDIIALVSDGVVGADDGEWLISYLSCECEENLNSLANELVVLSSQRNPLCDDTTVVLLRIKEIDG